MTIQFTEFDRPRRLEERVQMKAMDLTGALTFEQERAQHWRER